MGAKFGQERTIRGRRGWGRGRTSFRGGEKGEEKFEEGRTRPGGAEDARFGKGR